MKVLFASAEFTGLARVGGLADAAAGLAGALRRAGADLRVLLPAYRPLRGGAGDAVRWIAELSGLAGLPACRIGQTTLPGGVPAYLVDAPSLYDRPGTPYGSAEGLCWPDDHRRWARLSLAAAQIGAGNSAIGWAPDLLHCNDWPTGLAPAYLRWAGSTLPSVMTIHNIAHQGVFPAGLCGELGVPAAAFAMEGVEFHGSLSMLKAGCFYAGHVTTVSPNYAREITTAEFGGGLHGLMATRAREGRLSGILNGLDESWDAGSDPHLPCHFSPAAMDGKRGNAEAVRAGLCLQPSRGPLFGIVARLVHQKGLDLVAGAARDIVEAGGQIAMLGLGNREIEAMLGRTARAHRDDIALLVGFNEQMARRIIAGSDFFLMPSRFEPCGLTQMQAQRYGSLPVAHATGGLVDTVEDGRTGLLFASPSVEAVRGACRRAFALFADAPRLARMRRAAMTRRFGWQLGAEAYAALYERLCGLDAAGRRRPAARAWPAAVTGVRPAAPAERMSA